MLNGVEIVVVEDNLRVVTAPIRETLAKLGSLVGPLKKYVQTFFCPSPTLAAPPPQIWLSVADQKIGTNRMVPPP